MLSRYSKKRLWAVVLVSGLLAVSCSSMAETSYSPVLTETNQPAEQAAPAEPVVEAKAGNFISYATYQENQAIFDDTKVVYFFNARWCSTCRKAVSNIQSDLENIPASLTIVDVDFDNSKELRRKYLVTLQHTFVQIDTAGTEIAKWSGSVTAEQIFDEAV